ncbi:cytochrome P450 [Suillus spraguei]|nr:cytochrome P450 [Suillus spraguei]
MARLCYNIARYFIKSSGLKLVSYHEMYSPTGDLQEPIQPYTASLIMTVTYGHLKTHSLRVRKDSWILPDILFLRRRLPSSRPFLSVMKRPPDWCFGGAYALMGRCRELCQQLLNEPFDQVKAWMAHGTASKSLVTDFLSQVGHSADKDTMKASTSALHIFLMAMMLYPDVQARARAEIDQVVMPDKIDDRPSLPNLDAALYEVLRWHSPFPLANSLHRNVYDGYFIPKGTMVMVNQWSLSRDEDVFPDASRFDPTRHLTADGQLKDHLVHHFAFGHGR